MIRTTAVTWSGVTGGMPTLLPPIRRYPDRVCTVRLKYLLAKERGGGARRPVQWHYDMQSNAPAPVSTPP